MAVFVACPLDFAIAANSSPLPVWDAIALLGALPRLSFTITGDALTARLSPLYAAGPVAGVQKSRSR